MNEQPYGVPVGQWAPKMTPWWFHATHSLRRRALKKQQVNRVDVDGVEHLEQAIKAGHGVMITPNHSFHWDSYCLLAGAERLKLPFYIMSAWQVFAMSSRFERYSMQRCGCFSVDREGTDVAAMKTAIDILQHRPYPLVVFPEGDIYHTNDRVRPFRDGAAAMALMAARKSDRPVNILPVAIKRWYTDDPTPSMLATMRSVEERLYWRPRPEVPLTQRILQAAKAMLGLKELEHFGEHRSGDLPSRIQFLANAILAESESRYQIASADNQIPERVKEVRRRIIQLRQEAGDKPDQSESQWSSDMHNMFFVTQLYSYPGDYMAESPSWERVAETLDKLEEDLLHSNYPSVRGRKDVKVRFGAPIELPRGKEASKANRLSPATVTDQMEIQIQSMLDAMNSERASLGRVE